MDKILSSYRSNTHKSESNYLPSPATHRTPSPSASDSHEITIGANEKTSLLRQDGSTGEHAMAHVINPKQKTLQQMQGFFAKYFGCFTKKEKEDEEGFSDDDNDEGFSGGFGDFKTLNDLTALDDITTTQELLEQKTPGKATLKATNASDLDVEHQSTTQKKLEPYL
jgi:hypothetical protein